ncbi:hypothetical protein [Clostridium sp. KNHs214]|uniref:hypothetical protein n=1 Tax=Clostridium sp. KNHs214 TaxID=1540257 RepID=UPI00055584DD|nr:hypothetical protein [Clostridium sp. KNHs214]
MIDEDKNIQNALPLVAKSFEKFNGRVESVSLFHSLFLYVYFIIVIIGKKQFSEEILKLKNSYLKAMSSKQPLRLSE